MKRRKDLEKKFFESHGILPTEVYIGEVDDCDCRDGEERRREAANCYAVKFIFANKGSFCIEDHMSSDGHSYCACLFGNNLEEHFKFEYSDEIRFSHVKDKADPGAIPTNGPYEAAEKRMLEILMGGK